MFFSSFILLLVGFSSSFNIEIDSLFSPKTLIPLDPLKNIFSANDFQENPERKLGEIISGSNLYYLAENISKDNGNKVVKNLSKSYDAHQIEKIKNLIDNEYRYYFTVNSLPIVSRSVSQPSFKGISIGYKTGSSYYIRSNILLDIELSSKNEDSIVDFSSYVVGNSFTKISDNRSTYSYFFEVVVRHDTANKSSYIRDPDFKVPFSKLTFVTIFSSSIAGILLGYSYYILYKNRRQGSSILDYDDYDFRNIYTEGSRDWSILHGDVFRGPNHAPILASFTGIGIQYLCCFLLISLLISLQFYLLQSFSSFVEIYSVFVYFSSMLCGFSSIKIFKSIGEYQWKCTLIVSGLVPSGFILFVFIMLQLFYYGNQSSIYVSIFFCIKIIILFQGGCFLLHFIGSIPALKGMVIQFPTKNNRLPRDIPEQPWSNNLFLWMMLGGFIIFMIIIFDVHLILDTMWSQNSFYPHFGHLSLIIIIGSLTSAGISIISVFQTLSNENYKWWWRSFLVPASTGLYTFLFMLYYSLLLKDGNNIFPYLATSILTSTVISLIFGSSGFIGSLIFVINLFNSLKNE